MDSKTENIDSATMDTICSGKESTSGYFKVTKDELAILNKFSTVQTQFKLQWSRIVQERSEINQSMKLSELVNDMICPTINSIKQFIQSIADETISIKDVRSQLLNIEDYKKFMSVFEVLELNIDKDTFLKSIEKIEYLRDINRLGQLKKNVLITKDRFQLLGTFTKLDEVPNQVSSLSGYFNSSHVYQI